MKKPALRLTVCLVACAAVNAAPAIGEDLTIISTVTGGKGGPTTATQYISADKLLSSDGRNDTIMDLASGRMIVVDHKKKTYQETSLEEMRQHFAELESLLEDNPMMAAMLGSATTVDVKKGSGTRQVAGYTCDHYQMTIGAKFQVELWAARGLQAPAQYHDAQKMVYAAMGPMASRFNKLYEEMKKIDGVPLVTKIDTRVVGLKINSVSEATEVRKGPIPPETFAPPAGYKKKKSPFEK